MTLFVTEAYIFVLKKKKEKKTRALTTARNNKQVKRY
jgi:hypothetical protein